jgi:hypothetical protein
MIYLRLHHVFVNMQSRSETDMALAAATTGGYIRGFLYVRGICQRERHDGLISAMQPLEAFRGYYFDMRCRGTFSQV